MARSDPNKFRPNPWPPSPESAAMRPPPWAKRTVFRPKLSGETSLNLEAGSPRPGPATDGEVKEKENEPLRKGRLSEPAAARAVATVDVLPQSVLDSHMKYELRHTPGLVSSEVREGGKVWPSTLPVLANTKKKEITLHHGRVHSCRELCRHLKRGFPVTIAVPTGIYMGPEYHEWVAMDNKNQRIKHCYQIFGGGIEA